MSDVPEDRGPNSIRVAKLNLSNPIHAGIMRNKENNPRSNISNDLTGSIISMPVKAGNEAPPKESTKYPSFDTITEPYNPEQGPVNGPEIKPKKRYSPRIKREKKPEIKPKSKPINNLKSQSQKATSKEELRKQDIERRNAALRKK